MSSDFVDKQGLVYPAGKPELSDASGATLCDGAFIIISQAFCPRGHDLVSYPGPRFDGFPGISVKITTTGSEQVVTISPMHGDERKEGGDGFAPGAKCRLACPICDTELPVLTRCDCGEGQLHTLDLVRKGGAEVVAICDVSGCRRSRVAQGLDVLALFDEE